MMIPHPISQFFTAFLLVTSLHANPERGEFIYNQLCFTCHGLALEGGIGPSLTDSYWHHGSSPEAILDVINNGIEGSEMIAYKDVFPEADRLALRDYLISKQVGIRELVRSIYPGRFFKGKRLTPELFKNVESASQTLLPENWISMGRNVKGVLRATGKIYLREAGTYQFQIRRIGRTSIYLDGKEVHFSDDKGSKNDDLNVSLNLQPGTYSLEILHEEKPNHSYRFNGSLNGPKGKRFPLNGRSLQGNIPKVIVAGPEAKVVRKWIKDLPPRALLCLLPNKVIVAFNTTDGTVLKAWHSAEINQTPSLPDRSQKPSEINGTPISSTTLEILKTKKLQFQSYETQNEKVLIRFLARDRPQSVTISPDGEHSFKISTK
jgi:hypothetical protein